MSNGMILVASTRIGAYTVPQVLETPSKAAPRARQRGFFSSSRFTSAGRGAPAMQYPQGESWRHGFGHVSNTLSHLIAVESVPVGCETPPKERFMSTNTQGATAPTSTRVTAQVPFFTSGPSGTSLFDVRAGITYSDALQSVYCLLETALSITENMEENSIEGSIFGVDYLLQMSLAIIQSVSKEVNREA